MPIVLDSGACGAIRQGYHHRSYTAANTSHVMLSAVRAMGISAPTFGIDKGEVSDGLSEIET